MKIIVTERPYAGHGTLATHEYDISEGLKKIEWDKYTKEFVVEFDSCEDKLRLHIDDLKTLSIGYK